MSLRFSIALLLSIVFPTVPVWADFQAGLDAYERGDYATTVKEWRPLAEQGDSTAQHHLAWLYLIGRGVPQANEEAIRWLQHG